MQNFKTTATSLFLVLCSIVGYTQDWSQTQKSTSSQREMDSKFGNSIDLDDTQSVIGTFSDDTDVDGLNSLTNAGAAYFQSFQAGEWIEDQKVVASDRDANANFGNSVGVSGNYAVIGAYTEKYDADGNNEFDDAGAAYIYEKDINGNWIEIQKIVASDRDEFTYFGSQVGISGDYLVVGCPNNGTDLNNNNFIMNAGAIYVFERNTDTGIWEEAAKLIASDRGTLDFFGASVDISGNNIIVGSRQDDEDSNFTNFAMDAGSAYVFNRDMFGTWYQAQKISASDREASDWFGISVAIDGEQLIVGARLEDESAAGDEELTDAGSAYIFSYNGSAWIQSQKITPSDRASGDLFGFDVAIDEDRIVVSSRSDDEDENDMNFVDRAGSMYVFEKDNTETWNEIQKLVASDRMASDFFGTAVDVSGNIAAAGSRGQDFDLDSENFIEDAGAVYYYTTCNPVIQDSQISICQGDSILIAGNFESVAGVYPEILNTSEGCDSIINYTLTVGAVENITLDETICEGEFFEYEGINYTEEGEYVIETETDEGCINTTTINLSVTPILYSEFEVTICEGDSTMVYGEMVTTPGEYELIINPSSLGCDSIVTTTVFVNPILYNDILIEACFGDTIELNGVFYREDFNLSETFTSATGCDSIVTWTGNFIDGYYNQTTVNLCEGESVLINDIEVSEAGNYMENLTSQFGCDSIIEYNVQVFELPIIDLGMDQTICDTLEFVLDAGSGFESYDWSNGSDDQSILIVETDTYSVTVVDENECEGSDEVTITVDDCSLVIEGSSSELTWYPNPVQEVINLELNNSIIKNVVIYDLQGKIVFSENILTSQSRLNVSGLSTGTYLIFVETEQETVNWRFIKN